MKGLTLTIVTPKIQSVNYGETIGNVSTLKKLSTGTDYPKKLITYFSDKAIKYDVKRIGREQFNWKLMDKSVLNVFIKNCIDKEFNHDNFLRDMIKEYEEFDLFGGMFADIGSIYIKKEKKIKIDSNECSLKQEIELEKLKRSQPVRFSNGYSISEFVYDMNLLNDIDAYNRYIQYTAGQKKQSLVYPEEHFSYYTYTLTIDLDKVGAYEKEEDGKVIFEPVVDPTVRAKRINDILEIVLLYLNREIKGRKERLTPVFLIGGVYDVKHPFFANAIYFWEENQKLNFKAENITKILDTYKSVESIKENTFLYYDDSFVTAKENITIQNQSLPTILEALKAKVSVYYMQSYYDYAEYLIEKLNKKGVDINTFKDELGQLFKEQENIYQETKSLQEKLETLREKRDQLIQKLILKLNE